jgi:protein tyrosine kinase modulator
MGPIHTLDDVIDMLRRRAPVIVLVIVLGSVVSVLYALSRQHYYQSSEVLQVARPKVARDLARSTVAGSSARRLQLIEQRLMARDSVMEIIDAYELYADRPDLKPSQKVALLRSSVSIQGVAAAREGFADDGTVAVLTITATMPTAEQAQQVAQELSHRTINLSIRTRIDQARETLDFFSTQLQDISLEVAAKKQEIVDFRASNELIVPGSVEFRRAEIATLNEALLGVDRERLVIQNAAEQVDRNTRPATAARLLADYEIQLENLEDQRRLLSERKLALEQSIQASPEIERRLAALDRELSQLREQRDVIFTRQTEAEVGLRLESQRQSERLTVIEPAALPDYPISGSRKRTAMIGGVISVALALALAFLLDLRHPVIRSAAQMQREIGIQPVVSIPFLDTRPDRAGWLRRLWRAVIPARNADAKGDTTV